MTILRFSLSVLVHIALLSSLSFADDPTVYYELKVSYLTVSPLGVPQQVIAVGGKFPGPVINVTTNFNVLINLHNELNEDFLMTWPGIEMRRNSWMDGVPGTSCPIPPKRNFTYSFQVKDQIGSFFYGPSLNLQRASGGFGPFVINNRIVIPIPFAKPEGDLVIMIGDWYTRSRLDLMSDLESGKELGMPDGVLINGKGPYRYDKAFVPGGIKYETINVNPGKTYRIRVHNVGTSTSLNFRIQGHNLLLVETEGHYTVQQNYTSFDIHVGQSYSFLVTMDQNATSDYYIVASARFVNESHWKRVTGVAILHYSHSRGTATGPLPGAPPDIYNRWAAMNQPKSIRQNTSASGARPNPQGSFHYGSINVTDTYVIRSSPPVTINGKRRATLNGLSFVNPDTPIRLADIHNLKGDYKLDFPNQPRKWPAKMSTSLINATYKGFIEVVLQNSDTRIQSFHMDGYSFFVVGMDWGIWTEADRGQYNKWDAISRSTVEVYPGAWTAVYVSLDNVGVWNLRIENLDRWYLGQETYMKIINPEEIGYTEKSPPDNVRYCGALRYLQKDGHYSSIAVSDFHRRFKLVLVMLMAIFATVFVSC